MSTQLTKICSIYNKTINFALDLIFPIYCVGCGAEGNWICESCHKKIILIKYPYCPSCNKITPKGQFCRSCRKNSHLTGVVITAHYQEGPLKEAIHTFKYDGVTGLAQNLGKLLIDALKKRKFRSGIIIPVPLHKKRLAGRGFNQSELLTREITKAMPDFILNTNLQKIKPSDRQADLPRYKRLKNIKGKFAWTGKKNELQGKKVILVDDIYTTGATLNECAKVLKKSAGASRVWGLVLAKG